MGEKRAFGIPACTLNISFLRFNLSFKNLLILTLLASIAYRQSNLCKKANLNGRRSRHISWLIFEESSLEFWSSPNAKLSLIRCTSPSFTVSESNSISLSSFLSYCQLRIKLSKRHGVKRNETGFFCLPGQPAFNFLNQMMSGKRKSAGRHVAMDDGANGEAIGVWEGENGVETKVSNWFFPSFYYVFTFTTYRLLVKNPPLRTTHSIMNI